MPLAPGTRLGTYEIVAPLGAGGMGEVYRARDLRLGREVAIKVLPSGLATSPERLARFEREARTVAGLNHPNIVVLHSVDDEDGVRYLTMELVEGENLAARVVPGGLGLASLLELAIPLADALVAAHEKGVIHRDLKPANVMVTREGRVKVLDFGLARQAGAEPPVALSQAPTVTAPVSTLGQVLGTAPYMAPEQIRGEPADARSDLFAFGIMLYELATGRRPFTGETPADVGAAILRDHPAPVRSLRADLPHELDRIIGRCLEKDPGHRFPSARDLHDDLRRMRRGLDRESGSPTPPATPAPPYRTVSAPAIRDAPSIAVLPFVNRSADAENEYFSDGLAEELLNVLARIRGLRVVARTSSFQFKGRNDDIATVGRKLNVATVLEGSVRKSGSRVRISVQLVRVSDSSHLWSETYDRTLEDIFAVQDDIAQSVVKELRTTLLGEAAESDASGQAKAEVADAARGRGHDPEAHRLYLLARHLIDRHTREDTAKGIGYLNQALALDPAFALAWTELSRAYATEVGSGWALGAEGYGRAREAVERALALEPDLAEAHARMGLIGRSDRDWRGAERSMRRALELAPWNASVLNGAGVLAESLGRLEEAIGLYRRAAEQDPLSSTVLQNLGIALDAADCLAEAEEAFRKSLELTPQRFTTHACLALTLLARGRGEAALAEARREPEEAFRSWALGIIHHALGRRTESDEALAELMARWAGDSAYQIAEVFGARGEADAAFEWLERAYVQRDGELSMMKVSPRLRALYGDPRWSALLKRMGFEA